MRELEIFSSSQDARKIVNNKGNGLKKILEADHVQERSRVQTQEKFNQFSLINLNAEAQDPKEKFG